MAATGLFLSGAVDLPAAGVVVVPPGGTLVASRPGTLVDAVVVVDVFVELVSPSFVVYVVVVVGAVVFLMGLPAAVVVFFVGLAVDFVGVSPTMQVLGLQYPQGPSLPSAIHDAQPPVAHHEPPRSSAEVQL
jgi:hypothetical protein